VRWKLNDILFTAEGAFERVGLGADGVTPRGQEYGILPDFRRHGRYDGRKNHPRAADMGAFVQVSLP